MRKFYNLILCLFIFTFISTAAFAKTIAVIPFEGDVSSATLKGMTDRFIHSFVNLGYNVLSRDDKDLAGILKEFDFQTDMVIDDKNISEFALIGANLVLVGNVSQYRNETTVSVKIIDVQTGVIKATSIATMSNNVDYVSEMTKELDARLNGKKYVPKINSGNSDNNSRVNQRNNNSFNPSPAPNGQKQIQQYNRVRQLKIFGRATWLTGLATSGSILLVDYMINGYLFSFLDSNSYSSKYSSYDTMSSLYSTFFWTGVALFSIGVIMDVYFSIQEKALAKNLSYSFAPYVVPDEFGNVNMGGVIQVSYRF